MTAFATAHELSEAIARASRSAQFCVSGCLPGVDPRLEVDGVRSIRFPLGRTNVKNLIAQCRIAPYGKGTETLVDTKVRNTFELDPRKFRLGDEWNAAVAAAAQTAAAQLGLPGEQIEAKLYKLLIYESGGFFLPHRDSEKNDRMVASLIVVLPNQFEGGRLIVRHGAVKQTLKFEEARKGAAACFAAFYADCEHEVERVSSGVRIALAYNIVLKSKPRTPPSGAASSNRLTDALSSWIAKQPATPLVFALEHHYTQRGLSRDLLKGADRQFADLIVPAAEQCGCVANLAQVTRHLMQDAHDGSYERGSRWGSRPRGPIEIGETYEDELHANEWASLDGKKQPWGSIPLELSAIVSSIPIDEWKPTREDYEGYTGNAGNTLDRWYHRSALVVWHRDRHFDIVAKCGVKAIMPLFGSMVGKLPKTPKKRFDEARMDCVRLARAIAANWPRRHRRHRLLERGESAPLNDFPDRLLTLRDRDTIAMFLSRIAETDQTLSLASLIVPACREFGWNAFASELRLLLSPPPDPRAARNPRERTEIPLRDIEWLNAVCLDKSDSPERIAIANELCTLAVERFCAPFPPRGIYRDHSEEEDRRASVPLLLEAIMACRRDENLSRAISFVQASPSEFSLDDCQVPCLKELLPWSRKRLGAVPTALASWLESVRKELMSSTERQPIPPANWTRPAEVACTCQYCVQLNRFLADPANEIGRIAAPEHLRHHLIGMIDRHGCDVKHALERKGSPYSLVLNKTTGSFQRATKRFEADCRLLRVLDEAARDIVHLKNKS